MVWYAIAWYAAGGDEQRMAWSNMRLTSKATCSKRHVQYAHNYSAVRAVQHSATVLQTKQNNSPADSTQT
jgi:hypothetical protein